jgi:hypothetical protein
MAAACCSLEYAARDGRGDQAAALWPAVQRGVAEVVAALLRETRQSAPGAAAPFRLI